MLTRVAAHHALIAAALLLAQLGGGARLGRSPVEQIERSVTRPLPQAPAPSVVRSPDVWVPDRYYANPVQGGTEFVPGHWERRLSDGEYYAPPSIVCTAAGQCSTAPAGVRPPPDTRVTPFDTPMAP